MSTGKSHTTLGLLALLVLCGAVLSSKAAQAPLAHKALYDFNHLNSWGYNKQCSAYSFIDIPASCSKDCAQFFKLSLNRKFNANVAENQAVSLAGNFGQLRVLDDCKTKKVQLRANKIEFRAQSGHRLNGTAFDAELIMYFNRKGCKTVTHAVSVMLNAVATDMDAQDMFRATFSSAAVNSAPIIYQSAHKARNVVLPKQLRNFFCAGQNFYRYKGSMPTPPLTQDITWFVFEKPISVSRDDIEFLNSKYSSNKFNKGNNVGALQALNKRSISYTQIAGKAIKRHNKKHASKSHKKRTHRVVKSHGNKLTNNHYMQSAHNSTRTNTTSHAVAGRRHHN